MSKILLVEDNELNRDMLARRLERQGFQVILAENGQQGIDLAQAENPDMILMDMNLPEIDGWEATQRIKAQIHTQHIPVIALTSHAMAGDRERALAAQCNEYESKPIDFPRLLHKTHTLLRACAS